jgi:hypothetical protein
MGTWRRRGRNGGDLRRRSWLPATQRRSTTSSSEAEHRFAATVVFSPRHNSAERQHPRHPVRRVVQAHSPQMKRHEGQRAAADCPACDGFNHHSRCPVLVSPPGRKATFRHRPHGARAAHGV